MSYRFHRVVLQRRGWLQRPRPWRTLGLLVLALGWGGVVEIEGSLGVGLGNSAQAQVLRPEVRDPFLADPLADDPRDPLLPTPVVDRPLSPLELFTLEQDLNQPAREAEALAEAEDANGSEDSDRAEDVGESEDSETTEDSDGGEGVGESEDTEDAETAETAQDLWMREVRLRRVLGLDAELEAMERVAQWMRDRSTTQELQLLSARLDQILPTLDPAQAHDRERLERMATIYTTLGNVESAAALRRTLAEVALDRGDAEEHRAQLEALALLYDDWFYFPEAAAAYGDLVALVQTQDSSDNDDLRFGVRQIENLESAQQFAAALAVQQQLLLRYREEETLWPQMAALQYAIANNYQRVGDLVEASRQYQVAYTNAIGGQQFEIAAQTLRALADLYRQIDQWPDVDYLYQQLLVVERQALDAYGLMDTFDQIGQLYEQTENPDAALRAYQEGLALAHQLHHRQDYFTHQIQRLSGNAWIDSSPRP